VKDIHDVIKHAKFGEDRLRGSGVVAGEISAFPIDFAFPGQPGYVGTRKARDDRGFWMQWHQLDNMETICTSLQTDNHTNTSSLNFYRPDALPDAQPTVSKY